MCVNACLRTPCGELEYENRHFFFYNTNVQRGEDEEEALPRMIDLVQLEAVLEKVPSGLQLPEAVKAKKTAGR